MPGRTTPVRLRDAPWALHDVAASRSIEASARAGDAPQALMQRAGNAVAQLAVALHPHSRHIRVMAGPGNNGGDGLVAAAMLHRRGYRVDVMLASDPALLKGDAGWALGRARDAGVPLLADVTCDASPDLYIDALLGLGGGRAIGGVLQALVEVMNAGHAPVLSIDLPSGLNGDSGAVIGPAVRADRTLSLLTLKPGLFTAAGRDHAGQVWFDDLGAAPDTGTACAELPGRPRHLSLRRAHASHKGSFGDVCVIGGALGMVGAAWLAARAALAAGAGRVYCSPLDPSAALLLPGVPELMGRPQIWTEPAPNWHERTVVCGCGGGEAVRAALPPLLARAPRLVLDADALNAVAADASLRQQLRLRAARGATTVLTPHPLEAARLLGCSSAEVQADRLRAARSLADDLDSVVALKGSGTVIAAPKILSRINPSGNAALATAGTGDVLAGWIGGTWASAVGARSDPLCTAFEATVATVWRHGNAADQYSQDGAHGALVASSLIEAMRQAHG